MYKKLLPLLLFVLSGKALAMNFPIEVTEYIDDIKINAYIEKSHINEKSQWTPFKTAPPLTISDALKLVKTYMSNGKDGEDTQLIGIELKQVPLHDTYWHYLVKVKSTVNHEMQPHFYIVMMDGKVISALKRPDAIK